MLEPGTPLLFLSHAGVDTAAAHALKRRLEAAPEAREHGLRVWFDKDDLRAGEPWQAQLEEAIRHRSTAFAVYVGSRGVVNWIDAEIQLALGRAVTDPAYRFIPILAPQAPGPEALPGFVALYQGVADVERRPDQFAKLVAAILGQDVAGTAKLEAEPFFGLRAVDEDRAHLFFGREQETETLVRLLRHEPLVMVTGDNGSGKSSLARAGLVPHWRGGALAEAMGERPSDTIWHVIETQPRTRPFQTLAEAVGEAAKRLGLSFADRGTLESWACSGDLDQVRRALGGDLPPDRTRVLLLIDQFEELVTIAEPAEREPFVQLLLALADPNDPRIRVVLTMRRDYYNLVRAFPELYDRLEADGHRAQLILGRISPDGLRRVVTEPLRLAGVPEGDRTALADLVAAEMGDRPGDLALVQMALTETWDHRRSFGDHLLRAYAGGGRIEGVIARAAEDVYIHGLDDAERTLAEPVFIRLVRLGDIGGATRRLATRTEFDDAKWRLVQKLASKEAKRLVLVGGGEAGETAEIAHEALVTQWPRYQTWLSGRNLDGADRAADKRALDALTFRAVAWAAAPDARAKVKHLATGADLDAFFGLAERRPAWLSADEHKLVSDSSEAARRPRLSESFRSLVSRATAWLSPRGVANIDASQHSVDPLAEANRRIADTLESGNAELNLSGLGLSVLPEAIADLSSLRRLDLSDNNLVAIPDAIGRLTRMSQLDISRNQITTLPSTISRLTRLQTLDLSDNKLRTLPDGLRQLTTLERLFLHRNDALGIPVEVLGPTADAIGHQDTRPAKPSHIFDYYVRARSEGRSLNEAKLILVGYGGVGKTSLVNRLIHGCFNSEETKTEGINITDWIISLRHGDDALLHVWDFGGQDIMRATHQFFLTQRSIYLIVLTGREG